MELRQAQRSAKLIQAIRAVLSSKPDDLPANCAAIEAVISRIEKFIKTAPRDHLPAAWLVTLAGLRALLASRRSVLIAQSGSGDLVAAKTRSELLLSEFQKRLRRDGSVLSEGAAQRKADLCTASASDDSALSQFLLDIPLPAIYWKKRKERFPIRQPTGEAVEPPAPMVCVIAFLDNAPLVTPQLLRPDIMYPLDFKLRGISWPDDASDLHLDLLSTCPTGSYGVSKYVLPKPQSLSEQRFAANLSGQITFAIPQSNPFNDLVFAIRAAYAMPEGVMQEIPVIGHSELRLRVVSQQSHPFMTGSRRLDRHVEEILTQINKACPHAADELGELLPVLQTLTSLVAVYAQEAIFKGRSNVAEAEFQRTVLHDLRVHLGTDVQEHPKQAGGFTDIRYRGVIVELKVERDTSNRQEICRKYTSQTTQYAGVEARQVSILLVLDLTPKKRPPGDIRNDILLVDVETHGGADEEKQHPSKSVVFVVNGNMNDPSDYSA
jgi:hypothetical protein